MAIIGLSKGPELISCRGNQPLHRHPGPFSWKQCPPKSLSKIMPSELRYFSITSCTFHRSLVVIVSSVRLAQLERKSIVGIHLNRHHSGPVCNLAMSFLIELAVRRRQDMCAWRAHSPSRSDDRNGDNFIHVGTFFANLMCNKHLKKMLGPKIGRWFCPQDGSCDVIVVKRPRRGLASTAADINPWPEAIHHCGKIYSVVRK